MYMRRNSRHTVFSSSWSRRKQAEELAEWQQMALWDILREPAKLRPDVIRRYR